MKAVIVGATSGIGLEVARLLSSEGWTLALAGRRSDRLEQIRSELKNVVAVRSIDVTRDDAVALLGQLIDELGGMDLYFHSSGVGFQNVPLDVLKEMDTVATNCMGFTRMVSAAFHHFASVGKGHIACISSIAGTRGLGAAPAYSSSKCFQNCYMESLEQLARMRGLDIVFTDVRPGFVATDLLADGRRYPFQLEPIVVAKDIVAAIRKKRSVVVINWLYRIVVFFWRLFPRWLWVRLKVKS